MQSENTYAAFVNDRLIAAGSLVGVLTKAKEWSDGANDGSLLIFEDASGRQLDFNLSGAIEDVLARALMPAAARRGRPSLGVQSREVSLLPQHWEWLRAQPSGTSATLRRLIEAELNSASPASTATRARDAAFSFMTAMAGDRPGYEEACRALYRGEQAGFQSRTAKWPANIRAHARRLAEPWFAIAR